MHKSLPDNSTRNELLIGLILYYVVIEDRIVDKALAVCFGRDNEDLIVGRVSSEMDLGVGDRRVEVALYLKSDFLISSGRIPHNECIYDNSLRTGAKLVSRSHLIAVINYKFINSF